MNNQAGVVLDAVILLGVIAFLIWFFGGMVVDSGHESVSVIDVDINKSIVTVSFSNNEEYRYYSSNVDSSLLYSFKGHDALIYYSTGKISGKYVSDYKIYFTKNTSIKEVLYEKDGWFPWEHPPVRVIFADGDHFNIYGSADAKFDAYSQCIVHNGNQVYFNYYYNSDLDKKFRSVKPIGS